MIATRKKAKPAPRASRPNKASAERFIRRVERGEIDPRKADFSQLSKIICDAYNALAAMPKGHRSRVKVCRIYNAAVRCMHNAPDDKRRVLLGNRVYESKRGRR